MVESADMISAKLHKQDAIIEPIANIRKNSPRTVDNKVDFDLYRLWVSVGQNSTGKPSKSTSFFKCSSQGLDSPLSHFDTAFPDIPSISPSSF